MKKILFILAVIGCVTIVCCKKNTTTGSSNTTNTTTTGTSSDTTYHALYIPPTLTGTNFNLTIGTSSKQFFATGAATPTYSYNGLPIWGPTLIMNKGDNVTLNVTNNLTDTTTVHWHGFHIPAKMDGGPHQKIAPGTTWSPFFTVLNNASMYWYHPHLHQKT